MKQGYPKGKVCVRACVCVHVCVSALCCVPLCISQCSNEFGDENVSSVGGGKMTSFFSALSLYGLRLQGADGYHTCGNDNNAASLCTMTLYYFVCVPL